MHDRRRATRSWRTSDEALDPYQMKWLGVARMSLCRMAGLLQPPACICACERLGLMQRPPTAQHSPNFSVLQTTKVSQCAGRIGRVGDAGSPCVVSLWSQQPVLGAMKRDDALIVSSQRGKATTVISRARHPLFSRIWPGRSLKVGREPIRMR